MANSDPVTSSVRVSFDYSWQELSNRLAGLSDDEYLWEPIPGGLSVRLSEDGSWRADVDPRNEDNPPFTNIAWRLWHLVDCFDSYTVRAFGSGDDEFDHGFVGTAAEATAELGRAVDDFVAGFDAMGDRVGEALGPAFGPFAERNYNDLALHGLRELNHHGAEIALLRDLWSARFTA